MKIIRPLQIGFTHQVLEQSRKFYFTASATLGINLQTGGTLLDLNFLKDAFESMGETPLPDTGMPKPVGEFLVSGNFFAPGGKSVPGGEVKVRLGRIEKKLFIFGPRKWQAGFPSPPEEIHTMPLDYIKAFGGGGFKKNPTGTGFNDGLLPCIEDPLHLVASKNDTPDPVGFSPLFPMFPQRMKYQGTYDSDYKKKYFPGYPEDHSWKYFMCAPPDQWINDFFKGDETFTLCNMHPEVPNIEGRLPGLLARCFINKIKDGKERFSELPLNLDTIWFFPEKMLALLIFRGVLEVEDDEAQTISDVLCAYEDRLYPLRFIDYYQEAFEKRKNSNDGLLKNLNTQDLIPENHSSAMELLMEMGFADSVHESSALMDHMASKSKAMQKKADEDIETAVSQIENSMEAVSPPDKGRINIRKIIKEAQDKAPDPDLEEMNRKLESILPGITANDPKKLDIKNFSFDKIDELSVIVNEFADKKGKEAKDISKKEMEKAKAGIEKQIEDIDKQIEQLKSKDSASDTGRIASLQNKKNKIFESLKAFADVDPDGESKVKGPLPRIDMEKIKKQTENINPLMIQTMQHLQSMKAMGGEDEKTREMEKQLQDFLDNSSKQIDKGINEAQKGFKAGYIMSAHFMDEGLSPHKESLDAVKKRFLESVSKGEDVSGKDWACIDLSGENLNGIDLSGAFLEQVNFKRASLKGANFFEAILARADLEDSDFSGANLEKANIGAVRALKAKFTEANLKSAKLSKGDFTGSDFTKADLEGIELLKTVITGANFTKAHMPKVNFIESEILDVKFIHTDMTASGFIKCTIDNTDFSSSLMNTCVFVDSQLNHTCFENADLSKACFVATDPEKSSMKNLKFKNACLNQANFQNMDLQNSDLTYANIENAYFGGADLSNADLSHARAKNAQFRKAKLTNARLNHINLDQGSLEKANLVGASFKGANLHAVDFLRSTITRTDFTGSNLDTTLIENWRPE